MAHAINIDYLKGRMTGEGKTRRAKELYNEIARRVGAVDNRAGIDTGYYPDLDYSGLAESEQAEIEKLITESETVEPVQAAEPPEPETGKAKKGGNK